MTLKLSPSPRLGVCAGLIPLPVKSYIVTEASVTTNQDIHQGEKGLPSQKLKTQCSESQKGAAKPTPHLTPRTTIRVVTWKIRTMYEAGRTFQISKRNEKLQDRGTRTE
jgi:hypothetical protein